MLELGVVSAALIGALAYGTGDFIGGRATVRLSTCSVVAIAQTVAMVLMLQHFLVQDTLLPAGRDLVASLAAGLAYASAVILLYYGLAHGRIGVVAPLCGLFNVLVPLAGDLLIERNLADWHLVGIGLCCLAVVLIAGAATNQGRGRAAVSVRLGVVSGLGFGCADLWLGLVAPETAVGSMIVTRSVAAIFAASLAIGPMLRIAGRPPWPRGGVPDRFWAGALLAVAAGVLDTIGHVGYVLSARDGSMAVAAALVALFPAVSVLLAVVFLRETICRRQLVGFGACVLGVTLMTT